MVLGRGNRYEGGEEHDDTLHENDEFKFGDVDPADEDLEGGYTEEENNIPNSSEINKQERKNVRGRIQEKDSERDSDINKITGKR